MRLIEVPPSDDEELPCPSIWDDQKDESSPADRKNSRKATNATKKYKKEKSLGILCQ